MSPTRRRPRALAVGFALASALALAGCGSDKHVAPIVKGPVLPPGTPGNTAPDSTMLRWLTGYTVGVEGETDSLLTADFRFHFSSQVDPDLVGAYGNNWGKPYEVSSLHHLLHGFTNSAGTYVPGASAMGYQVSAWKVGADTTHADSAAWYRVVYVGQLALTIDLTDASGPFAYNIACPLELFFVRGDVIGALTAVKAHAERSPATPVMVAPFFRTAVGTDKYVDDLW